MSNPMRYVRPEFRLRALKAADFYRERQRRRQDREFLANGQLRPFEQVFHRENLLRMFETMKSKAGQAPGLDGLKFSAVSRKEAPRLMDVVSECVLIRAYKPWPGRTTYIPKANSTLRKLTIRSIIDRVVDATLNDALRLFWDKKFLPRSHGFRLRLSTWTFMAQLNADILREKKYVLAVDDVKDAFPSTVISDVLADHAKYITCPKYLALVETILKGGDPEHRIGIAQGSPYSPTALNVRLHHAHDVVIAPFVPLWYRYADNLAYLCQSVSEGVQCLERGRSTLSRSNYTLKGVDDPPVDLRVKNTQILGFSLSVGNDGLRLDLGEEAWNRLRQALQLGHQAIDPLSHARRAVDGWINAYGPAFEYRQDKTLTLITEATLDLGYPELDSPENLMVKMEEATNRWRVLRDGVSGMTAPSMV